MSFTFYKQLNAMDCGATCLKMVARYYGKSYTNDALRQLTGFSKQGVSLRGISEAAEKMGFRTRGARITVDQLEFAPVPSILHWDQSHFVVQISASKARRRNKIRIADPAKGVFAFSPAELSQHWLSGQNDNGERVGIILMLEPSTAFYERPDEKIAKNSFSMFFAYLKPRRWQLFQVVMALFVTSLLSLLFPFLTRNVIDTGIATKDLNYIFIILLAQLMLTISRATIDFIRSRIVLKISNILVVSILSDFWIKLTRLPVSYFDNHQTGDTLQRIGDHRSIQTFLTGTALNAIFSILNLLVYTCVLITYSIQLFIVFFISALVYLGWIGFFMHIRRRLNYKSFHLAAKENNATLQLVNGMAEIKLNNAEHAKRWHWENIQALLFDLNFKTLNYSQWQQAGALFINQSKDFIIMFYSAKMVIEGHLTLGTMLAIQFIVGQLSNPVEQLIAFAQGAQDAKISLERLNEVHQLKDEEPADRSFMSYLPENKDIFINKLSFSYPGSAGDLVVEDLSLVIPEGKVTAIVGSSGSGKTTLLKLLLKFYDSYEGEIRIGNSPFRNISPSYWRSICGAVMQDGYIFDDTVAGNIAVGHDPVDFGRLISSAQKANILPFIETLPNGFYTKLGTEGLGVSQGQKQRLLIARALYKDPAYLFFDEATNALDANNEIAIVRNLENFFYGRTVVIVAHRLSTVRNADNIIVLHQGRIVEEGTHDELSIINGFYYRLIKNQLELGS